MSSEPDHHPEDDSHPEQGVADRQTPADPRSGGGKPTGEKQAAANRENDPPA